MDIRQADMGDINQLIDLMLKFYEEGEIIEPVIAKLAKSKKEGFEKYLKNSLASEDSVIYLAEQDKIVLGFIRCVVKANEPFFEIKKFSKLIDFYVVPNHRGKGIGNELLKKVFSWAKKNNAPDLFLGSLSKNKLTHEMYVRKGFYAFEKSYWKNVD